MDFFLNILNQIIAGPIVYVIIKRLERKKENPKKNKRRRCRNKNRKKHIV